jgi:eukaryotic-like serine/threonine-protein kinase
VPVALPELPRNEGEGASTYAVSTQGTLVYLSGGAMRRAQRLVWVDRSGMTEALPLPERDYHSVVISPDGRQAIVQLEEGIDSLWLYDFARQSLTPFATSGGSSQSPVWTPDGKRVIYRGTRGGFRNLYSKAADGSGEEERLTTKADVVQAPTSVSPDGRWLVFDETGRPPAGVEIWRMPLDDARTSAGSGQAEPADARVPSIVVAGGDGRVSPDGKWMAYQSLASGRYEIYVQPFGGSGPLQAISTGGGFSPLWSHDGSELYYTTLDKLMAVDVTTTPTFSVGTPHVVYEGRYRGSVNGNTPYDVSADGRRFLRVQQVQPDRAVSHIDVVLNWLPELDRAMSSGGAAKR